MGTERPLRGARGRSGRRSTRRGFLLGAGALSLLALGRAVPGGGTGRRRRGPEALGLHRAEFWRPEPDGTA